MFNAFSYVSLRSMPTRMLSSIRSPASSSSSLIFKSKASRQSKTQKKLSLLHRSLFAARFVRSCSGAIAMPLVHLGHEFVS